MSAKFANFRRAAQQTVANTSFRSSPATAFADKRAPLVQQLSAMDRQLLLACAASDGRTEADVFLVLKAENPGRAGRAAVETDTAPHLVATEVIGLDQLKHASVFALPLQVVSNPEFRLLVPDFNAWLLTCARYPSYNEYSSVLVPQATNVAGMKKTCEMDKLDVHFGFLAGTLGAFWAGGDDKHARFVWTIIHSLRLVLSQQLGLEVTFDEFRRVIEARDASHDGATAFKRTMEKMKPSSFYSNIFQAFKERPELVHRTRFMNLDYLLLGLMSMPLQSESQDVYTPHATHVLRAILERTLKSVSHRDTRSFVDRQALIEYVQTTVGGRVETSLRYWAFFVQVLRRAILGPVLSVKSFAALVTQIRAEIKAFEGGLSGLLLLIAPECGLQDDDLAELILAATETDKADKQFATLQLRETSGATPRLDAILRANIERLQREEALLQQQMEVLQTPTASSPANVPSLSMEEVVEVDIMGPWSQFYAEHHGPSGNTRAVIQYIRMIAALAQHGSRPKALMYMVQQASAHGILGTRRSMTVARLFANPDSDVFCAVTPEVGEFKTLKQIYSNLRCKHTTRRSVVDMLRSSGANTSLSAVAQTKSSPTDDHDTTPATFVKFDLARVVTAEYTLRVEAMQGALQFECAVCLIESKSKPVVLHGDYRHAICEACAAQLKECPFCRQEL